MEGSGVVKVTSNQLLVMIWITMLTVQLEIRPILNKLGVHSDEIFRTALL